MHSEWIRTVTTLSGLRPGGYSARWGIGSVSVSEYASIYHRPEEVGILEWTCFCINSLSKRDTKLQEEMEEFREASKTGTDKAALEDEFGDILFSLINFARYKSIDPETALEKVNQKFKRRFEYIERHAPKALTEMKLEEMDLLWNEAKMIEKGKSG